MNVKYLQGKKILLIGYGVEGKTTHEFLKKHLPNAEIGIADKTQGEDYLSLQDKYDIAIKSPGIHKSKVTIPYTTATNLFFENVKGTTIGITGTKGKSTTTALIYTILKKAGKKVFLLGNITHKLDDLGKPLLSQLGTDTEEAYYVCELSSHQLDDLEHAPHIAVFTSFFPEHMDFHGSVADYLEAKSHITTNQTKADFFIYNPHFPEVAHLATTTKAHPIPFVQTLDFPENLIPLLGQHNRENVKAAVTVAQLLGIDNTTIREAVAHFRPLPHRLENVGEYKGITFYDDAISTTPQSTIQALHAIPHIQTLFLGGQDRGFDFRELAEEIAKSQIDTLVLFPESGEKILRELLKHLVISRNKVTRDPSNSEISHFVRNDRKYTILQTRDMKEAVAFAYAHTDKGHAAVLSTASPSYSVWKNFEEKGNLFKQWVKELGK